MPAFARLGSLPAPLPAVRFGSGFNLGRAHVFVPLPGRHDTSAEVEKINHMPPNAFGCHECGAEPGAVAEGVARHSSPAEPAVRGSRGAHRGRFSCKRVFQESSALASCLSGWYALVCATVVPMLVLEPAKLALLLMGSETM